MSALPRAQQVDSVVKSMLGGQVSAETRQVLMSGENPMLKNGAANDVNGMVSADDMDPTMGRGRGARPTAKDAGGKGFPRGRGAQIPGFGRPVDLKGLPQVVGLGVGCAGVSTAVGR